MPSWTYDGLSYRRRPTRTVWVGDVAVGAEHPIRVQSMTTPATTDVPATVSQIARLVEVGCEIVRVTVPTVTDAGYLPGIKAEMRRRGVHMPVVADIHFSPAAAMAAVEHVEKVRVNPGNYVDSKRFEQREYTDDEYAAEVERIAARFLPLVDRARELGVAIRVGTNHGSLSDRIMNRFWDSLAGMVESSLEFLRIARYRGFHDLVLSMKSSNPMVMIQAYRLLAERMEAEGMDYPFHLGVTEAGDGEDGRVKSAVGMGPLLDEGIGDTIRVSLTPQPDGDRAEEVRVSQQILQSLGIRPFLPSVTACPGCGRTTSTYFQALSQTVERFLTKRMPEWKKERPQVASLKVAVMGCVVNGPGESKAAHIGISLPGTGEAPCSPVYVDGEQVTTLEGPTLQNDFLALIETYVASMPSVTPVS